MSSNLGRALTFLIVLGMLFTAGLAGASTFVALDSSQLIEQSDRVVEGRVIAIESFWDEAGRLVVTEATVQVDETLVGRTESVVKVRTPGGTVGRFRVEAAGFPVLALDEKVILFLREEAQADYHRVVGFQQGHFEVVERNDGVKLAVPRIEGNGRYVTLDGRRLPAARSSELGQFKETVRAAAREMRKIVR